MDYLKYNSDLDEIPEQDLPESGNLIICPNGILGYTVSIIAYDGPDVLGHFPELENAELFAQAYINY